MKIFCLIYLLVMFGAYTAMNRDLCSRGFSQEEYKKMLLECK